MLLLTNTTINESMLVESLENNAITHIRIVPIGKKFSVYISLTWKDGESLLVTAKNNLDFGVVWIDFSGSLQKIQQTHKSLKLALHQKGKNDYNRC